MLFQLGIPLLFAPVLVAGAAVSQRAFTVGQIVQTKNGMISGHAAPKAALVSEYLGIPFAKPPLGDLRYAPPVSYVGNGQTFNAKAFSPSCPAFPQGSIATYPYASSVTFGVNGVKILDDYIGAKETYSEDCLTLNVWTKPQTGETKKAVLLWIYGGANAYGASNVPLYNGQFIADQQDVVVVTFNYRTNIFGYAGAPNLSGQNAGLLDQRMAVTWVRDNIAAFSGDPTRITLFGQSAGAEALDLYSVAFYNDDPIVNGFIQESGTALGNLTTAAAAASYWYQVTSAAGCGSASTANQTAVLACMRALPFSTVSNAVTSTSTTFGPLIDGVRVFNNTVQRIANGMTSHRPILMGTTDSEYGFYQPITQAWTGTPIPQSTLDFYTLYNFNCPCQAAAQFKLNNGIATWRYRWFGLFDNTIISTKAPSGAYHTSEIAFVFNTTQLLNGPADTSAQQAFTAYIQSGWAAFAKNPDTGLTSYGWPMYNPSQQTLMQLGLNNAVGPQLAYPAKYDNACASLE